MESKENTKKTAINNLEESKPKDNINFLSKVKKLQDDSLKKKVNT